MCTINIGHPTRFGNDWLGTSQEAVRTSTDKETRKMGGPKLLEASNRSIFTFMTIEGALYGASRNGERGLRQEVQSRNRVSDLRTACESPVCVQMACSAMRLGVCT